MWCVFIHPLHTCHASCRGHDEVQYWVWAPRLEVFGHASITVRCEDIKWPSRAERLYSWPQPSPAGGVFFPKTLQITLHAGLLLYETFTCGCQAIHATNTIKFLQRALLSPQYQKEQVDHSGRRKELIWVSSFRLLVANTTGVHTANNKTFTYGESNFHKISTLISSNAQRRACRLRTSLHWYTAAALSRTTGICSVVHSCLQLRKSTCLDVRGGDSKITGDPTHPHSPPALNWSPLADVTGLCTHTPQACWAAFSPPQAVRLPNQWPPPVYLCIYSLQLFKFLLLLLNRSFFAI